MSAGSLALPTNGTFDDRWTYEATERARPGRLPPAASELLESLRLEAEDLNSLVNATFARIQREREEIADLRWQIAQFDQHTGARRNDRERVYAEQAIVAARNRMASFEPRRAEQAARWEAAKRLVDAIDAWREQHAEKIIVEVPIVAPKLGKGERTKEAVDRLRGRIAELKAEAHKVATSQLTAAEAKERARAYVAHLARVGRPDVAPFLTGDRDRPYFGDAPAMELPPVYAGDRRDVLVAPAAVIVDGMSVQAWMNPDALVAAIEREIDASADDTKAMTAEARTIRTAELQREILATEREEEALVRLVLKNGSAIDRRADADPRAVLAVEIAAEAA